MRTSKFLLLDLITHGKLTFDPNHVDIQNVTATTNIKYNTTATIVSNVKGLIEGSRSIQYTRKSFENYLNTTQIEVPAGEYTHTNQLLPIINRKYNLHLVDSDILIEKIVIEKLPHTLRLTMRPNCPFWIGGVDVKILSSAKSLDSLFTDKELTEEFNNTVNQNIKPLASVVYWSVDFSIIYDSLSNLKIGSELDLEFISDFNIVTEHTWVSSSVLKDYNLKGARVIYNGPVKDYSESGNDEFSHMCVIELNDKYCNNFYGHLYLHYEA
jgi:hypothetical protein